MVYTVIYTKEETGGYTTQVVELPGCISYGANIEEAQEMTKEAISAYLESLKKHEDEDYQILKKNVFISNLMVDDVVHS